MRIEVDGEEIQDWGKSVFRHWRDKPVTKYIKIIADKKYVEDIAFASNPPQSHEILHRTIPPKSIGSIAVHLDGKHTMIKWDIRYNEVEYPPGITPDNITKYNVRDLV